MIKNFKCWLFGHDYFLIQILTEWSRRIGCKRCHKTFGMNDNVMCVIPWDEELQRLYTEGYKIKIVDYKQGE